MAFCEICGTRLIEKECKGEDCLIPFCPKCGEYRFPKFSTAVITTIFNKEHTKVMMMRQYGREKYNMLAGYVNKGEDAETALRREMKEEMNMTPIEVRYLYSAYFDKSQTLMLNYMTTVDNDSLDGRSEWEVDDAKWFTYEEAIKYVIKHNDKSQSMAERMLDKLKNEFKK